MNGNKFSGKIGSAPTHNYDGVDGDENVTLLSMTSQDYEYNANNISSTNLKYTISNTIARLRNKPPKDRCYGVAVFLICQGIAAMLTLTVFLLNVHCFTATISGVDLKNVTDNNTFILDYEAKRNVFTAVFINWHQPALFIPLIAAVLINSLCQGDSKPSSRRTVISLIAMLVPIIVSTAFSMFNSIFPLYAYFAVFTISFIWIGGAVGVFLSCLFSFVPAYPRKYINFLLIGMGLGGIIHNVVLIIIRLFTASEKINLVYSMVTVVFFISLALIAFLLITLSKVHRHYRYLNILIGKDYFESETRSRAGFPYSLRRTWYALLCTLLAFFGTYSIYPVVLTQTPFVSDRDYIPFPEDTLSRFNFLTANNNFWSLITNLLAFNVFITIGSMSAHCCQQPKASWLIVPTILRLLAVLALHGVTDYRSDTRQLPYFVDIDVCKLAITALTAYSGGYLSSVALIHTPRLVQARYSGVAGMIGCVAMTFGMGLGVCACRLYAFIVDFFG